MHIVYVNKTAPHRGGGAEMRIWEVGKRLVQRGFRVTVLCSATDAAAPEREILDGMQIEYVEAAPRWVFQWHKIGFYASRLLFYARAGKRLEQLLQTGDVDILRDDISPFPTRAVSTLAARYGLPTIAMIHNVSGAMGRWVKHYGPFLGVAGYMGERWLKRKPRYDHMIAAARWMAEVMARAWSRSRVSWVPNGVDASRFHPPSPDESSERMHEIRFFYVARFVELKGHDILLQAFARVVRQERCVRLHLVGDGPLEEDMRAAAAKLGLEDYVRFHGRVSRRAMPSLYRSVDAYVSPSYFEGMPITFLEAMASGLPIISTRIEAVDGFLSDERACLVRPGAVDELSEAMLSLARDAEKRRFLGEWGRQEAERRYVWPRIVDQEVDICRRVLYETS